MFAYSPCMNCVHFSGKATCVAFPDRIPAEIIQYGEEHDTLRGDEAVPVTFEVRPDRVKGEEGRQRFIALGRARREANYPATS